MTEQYNEEISFNSYQVIWDKVISRIIDSYRKSTLYVGINTEEAFQTIWENYVNFKNHARQKYMANPNGLLDRHKVCACMIYSITKSSPFSVSMHSDINSKQYDTINEDLALTTGLSLLRAFVISAINEERISQEEKEILVAKFANGFKYPKSNHGEYRDNFLSELHYTKIENNYNILSLAHSLFLLETYTKIETTS